MLNSTSLVAPEVVGLTTPGAISDDKVGIMVAPLGPDISPHRLAKVYDN